MGHEIIKQLREERGWTLRELAKRMGSYPQQISKYELGQNALTIGWIKKFAQVFGVPPSAITDGDPKTQRFADNASRKLAAFEPGHGNTPRAGEITVHGAATASEGRIDDIGTEKGALDLGALRNIFAVTVPGNAMEPRYRHGDYVLVMRDEWPHPHQDCLIETADGHGFIKTYLSHTDKKLTCEQLNPRRKWEIPMSKVKTLHLIRGKWK